ncbi:low affinity immunoglobulin epsilon Fc receptor-like isoform X2 [Mercenaria mercenaria]|uniref:low affinity immunoglobulin epsilon Fc receptor-like isoform X2 n=1 Tax=Mercenaria mercenaria TaxID=6596 RepID=UPI001E1DAB84|nr:low affinity immunoglobulin epsilon Fc receptor-like isoform X2 [Mercenaria mercenaria]
MGSLYVFMILFSSSLVFVADGSCPNGWIRHGTTCYHFSHDTEPMLLAGIACQQMDGALVEIESKDENVYLAAHGKDLNTYYFIGLTDLQEETVWVWNGSKRPLTTTGYITWRPGEPNSVGSDENCVVMDTHNSGQWVDVACHTSFHYICEKKDTESEIIG